MKCIRVVSLIIILALAHSVSAYNPPDGPNIYNANINIPKSHGTIAIKALGVLRGDGKGAVADFYQSHIQQLLDGTRQADTAGGAISLGPKSVDKNSFTHFYNPLTQKGFVLDFGEFNVIKNVISLFSLAPYTVFTLKGPHPAMTDMADWYYARAVKAMRQGNKAQAITYLGYVIHYISDATVPQHVCDEGAQKPGSMHVEYEDYCDTVLNSINHATFGGVYKPNDWTPGQILADAACFGKDYISQAKDRAKFNIAASALIPLAERYSAGILDRFYRLWQSENFKVVVLTIDRVKAVKYSKSWKNIDYPDEADFYAYVTIAGKNYETGVVDGANDMYPNSLIPYAWFFPKWISSAPTSIQIKIAIWDDDGVTGDDKAYICPKSGEKELWINYNLSNGSVSGDTSAPGGTVTSVNTKGNHDGD